MIYSPNIAFRRIRARLARGRSLLSFKPLGGEK